MEAARKLEDGKFLKVVFEDGEITILGDFFVHPEVAIEDLEAVVERELEAAGGEETSEGVASEAAIDGAIREYVETEGVDLVGITPAAIADLAVEVAE